MSAPEPHPRTPADGPALARDRGRRLRRIQGAALAASALLHVVALMLYPRLFGGLPDAVDRGDPDETRPPDGIEIVNLIETEAVAEAPPPEPEPETEREPVPVPVRPRETDPDAEAPPAAEAVDEPTGARSAAERLQPNTDDGRLWQPLPEEITALTMEQQIENLLYARLIEVNDSAAARALREADALDWTYTDDEGRRWGVSPAGIHLGDVTIPLPTFAAPAGESRDMRRLLDLEAEIRRAAGQGGVDQTLREAAEEIRRRVDEERRRRRNPPDTTRSGGGP